MAELQPHDAGQLSAAEEADLVRYGAISPFALGALLLGLLSATMLLSLLALPVPLAAVIVALVALQQIKRSDGAVVGRWAALGGLVLALAFTSTAIAKLTSRELALRSQARIVADHWLKLVQAGRLHEAHQLQLPPAERKPGGSLDAYYAGSPTARDQMAALFRNEPLSTIARSPKAKVQFVHFGDHAGDYGMKLDQIGLIYELTTTEPVLKTQPVLIVAERTAEHRGGPGQWRVQVPSPSEILQQQEQMPP